ncbi:PREDICTED: protein ACCELERATED CELL DEATH 6-like isoform X2 [Ipomoea nil]|uniref:protein ACCELERATED CELL DEATH 6-like isoform X2 n=1 Tax=Ipomoea nil TaxID=35883 RepID=UPI0009017915|nr:PREDICTED: protein ACCELERATED CELL DEATH 6-like isoform X2 [Ipomoea nil]
MVSNFLCNCGVNALNENKMDKIESSGWRWLFQSTNLFPFFDTELASKQQYWEKKYFIMHPVMVIHHMNPVLYNAVVKGNVEDYHEALRQMPEEVIRFQVTPKGNTVLHVAAIHGHIDLVEQILEEEVQDLLFVRNNRYESALHCAAEKGYDGVVSVMFNAIKKREDVESKGGRVREMIEMRDSVKDTALHKAVRMGYLKVVKLLVEEDPKFVYLANDAEETPIYIAAESQFNDCLKEMLNTCKKPTYSGPWRRNALHGAILSGISDGPLSKAERSRLNYDYTDMDKTAIYDGTISPVGRLIWAVLNALRTLRTPCLSDFRGGGNPSQVLRIPGMSSHYTKQLTHWAVEWLHSKFILRSYDVDRRDKVDHRGILWWRRLMLNLKSGYERDAEATVNILECTKLLLQKEISLCDETDDFGLTPLHCAVNLCDIGATTMILEENLSAAYVRAGNGNEWTTIFHIAVTVGNIKMLKKISESCPDCWEMTNSKLQNVFHEAVLSKRVNAFEYVLRSPHIDNLIDEKDENGNTPLHMLAISDCHHLQRAIKRHTRKHLVFNKHQQTPFDMALEEREGYFLFDIFRQGGKLVWSENKVGPRGGDLTRHRKEKKSGDKEINTILKSSETNIIVATLILTVTFAAGFTVPGGYDGNPGLKQGKPILLRNTAFIVFVVADTIAFICSILSIFLYIVMAKEASSSSRKYRTILKLYREETSMTYYATFGVVIAFVSGLYATLASSNGVATAVIVISLVIPVMVDLAFGLDQEL